MSNVDENLCVFENVRVFFLSDIISRKNLTIKTLKKNKSFYFISWTEKKYDSYISLIFLNKAFISYFW